MKGAGCGSWRGGREQLWAPAPRPLSPRPSTAQLLGSCSPALPVSLQGHASPGSAASAISCRPPRDWQHRGPAWLALRDSPRVGHSAVRLCCLRHRGKRAAPACSAHPMFSSAEPGSVAQLSSAHNHGRLATVATAPVSVDPKGSWGLGGASWARPDKCHWPGHVPRASPSSGQGWPLNWLGDRLAQAPPAGHLQMLLSAKYKPQ